MRIFCVTTLSLLACSMVPGAGVPVDLANPGPDSMAVYYRSAQGGQRGVPTITGDFDGDGSTDTAGSPFSANTLGRSFNGQLIVVFGDGTFTPARIDTGDYDGPMLVVHGAEDYSLLGVESFSADVDGDGFDDIVLGSSHGVFRSIANTAGEVVVLFGNAEWGVSITELDMADLPPEQRTKFYLGQRSGDRLGSWFHADDIDKNGVLDLVMGMDLSDGATNNNSNAGAAVIAWDVANAHSDAAFIRVGDSATSDSMTVIYGKDSGDLFGATNYLGDLDNDGNLELVASAGVSRSGLSFTAAPLNYPGQGGGDGPDGLRSNAGETTIFWNAANLKQYRTLDLSGTLPDGVDTTIIYGENSRDFFGEELAIDDLTGDGFADLFVGSLSGKNKRTGTQAGAGYIIPGGARLRGLSSIDTAFPPADYITAIYGVESSGIAGDTSEVADINGDGIADLFYAVPQGTPGPGRSRAGYTTIVYGGQDFPTLPSFIEVELSPTPELLHALVLGVDPSDLFAYSSAVGDLDGDGVADYVGNAMIGDGFDNAWANAGEYYVMSGVAISRHAAAPTNLISGTATDDFLLAWDDAQPIFGGPVAYDITFDVAGTPTTVRVGASRVAASDFSATGDITAVTAIGRAGSEEEQSSITIPVDPPIRVEIVPTPVPTPVDMWILSNAPDVNRRTPES